MSRVDSGTPALTFGPAAPARLTRVARQYGWLMLDQGIFAATNLILNVLFAHWLTPSEYGRFGVTFSGFILLSVLHWFMMVEPLLVEAAHIGTDQVRAFVTTVIRLHVFLLAGSVVVAGGAYLVGAAFDAPETGMGVAAALAGGCAILTLATARRLCLAFLSTAVSAIAGVVYLAATTMTAWMLYRLGLVAWQMLWVVMSWWSLVCAAGICWVILSKHQSGRPYRVGDLYRATSRYALWGTFSAGFSWIRSDGMFAVLALTLGLPAVAQTRAIVTLSAPVVQVNSALSASWLVDFGRRRREPEEFRRLLRQRAVAYASASLLILFVAWLVSGSLTTLIYGGKYDAGAWLMPLFLAAYLLNGLEGMLTGAMKARGIIRNAYLPQIVGSVAVGLVAIVVIPGSGPGGGPAGAALSVLAGAAVGLVSALILFIRGGRPSV